MSVPSPQKIQAKTTAITLDHPPDEHFETRPGKSMTFNASPDLRVDHSVGQHPPNIYSNIINLDKPSEDSSRTTTNRFGFPLSVTQIDKNSVFSPRVDDMNNLLAEGRSNLGANQSDFTKQSANFETKLQKKPSENRQDPRPIPRNSQGYEPSSIRESFEGLNQMFQNNPMQMSQVQDSNNYAARFLYQTDGALVNENIRNFNNPNTLPTKEQTQLLVDTLPPPLSSQSPPNSLFHQPSHSKISLLHLPNSVSTTQPRQPQNSRTGINISNGSGNTPPILNIHSTQQPTKPTLRPQQSISLHIHRLSHFPEYLSYEKKKILGILIVSVIGGVLQIINRGTRESNYTFVSAAVTSTALQIICLLPIILRLQQISAGVLNSLSTLASLVALLSAQLFRTLVFTSNYLSDHKEVSSIEAIFELSLIMQLSHQTLRAFPIFRGKEKVSLFHAIIAVAATISLLINRDTQIDSIELILCIMLFSFVILRLFLFHELPFSICKLYNARHGEYSEMRKSYFSLMASESSQLGSADPPLAANKNKASNEKPHDSTELWRLRNRQSKDGGKGEYDELESKYDAKKMLSQASVLVFLNSKLYPTYFSPKMKHEIGALFMTKDTPKPTPASANSNINIGIHSPEMNKDNAIILNNPTTYANKNEDQNPFKNNPIQNSPNNNDKVTIPPSPNQQPQSSIPASQEAPHPAAHPPHENKTQAHFQILMDNIILERVDNETLHCWEALKKTTSTLQQQQQDKQAPTIFNQFKFPNTIPNIGDISPGLTGRITKYLQQPQEATQITSTFSNQPLHLSQFNIAQQNLTYRDLITARNSFLLAPKASFSALTQNNIGYSSRIGLKSKFLMISLKDFLEKVASNPGIFGKFGIGVPIVIASFQLQGETENKTQLQKYQIKIYPQWRHSESEVGAPNSLNNSVQSMVTLTTSKKYNLQENEQEHDTSSERPLQFLLVFEEVKAREDIIAKSQFYKFLKSIFRCFNNDLSRSLANILGTSQAGALNRNVEEKFKEQFLRPILLSCKIIKYILHNLRDFNDIVGERFHLQIRETSIPKMAEDSVMLFKATSDKKISYKVVIEQDVPMFILTDQRRLVQIILTLLSNAHKHTATGSLTFRIFHPKLGEITMRSRLRFQVEDTGDGMESSVQERLSKLFISGIGQQDFKAISTFGFNLFICNILAKKLFYPDYQFRFHEARDIREFQSDPFADPSGIKFQSNFGQGSTFYFDIKLIEERKYDKMMDSIFNDIGRDQVNPLDLSTTNNQTNQKNFRHLVQNFGFLNNTLSQNVGPSEHYNFPPSIIFAPHQQPGKQLHAINNDGTDIPDEEIENEKEKYESRVMTFQLQPKGLHSDYKFLKCDCKNVLIIDKVQSSLDSMEMFLRNFHFLAHKCRSIKEAVALQTEKSKSKCTVCNQNTFMCIFARVDEFLRQNEVTFVREFEDFTNSAFCKDSILIAVVDAGSPSHKWLESLKIDDFLSTTFDSIEIQNLIDKWKLLPLYSESYISQQISISNVTNSNQR